MNGPRRADAETPRRPTFNQKPGNSFTRLRSDHLIFFLLTVARQRVLFAVRRTVNDRRVIRPSTVDAPGRERAVLPNALLVLHVLRVERARPEVGAHPRRAPALTHSVFACRFVARSSSATGSTWRSHSSMTMNAPSSSTLS